MRWHRRRRLGLALVAHLLLLASLVAVTVSARPEPAEASHGRIAIVAPITAYYWNAQCYGTPQWPTCGAGGLHATNGGIPVDIGNGNPGHWAFFQIDYVPSNIGGGMMQAYNIWQGCANHTGGNYNGHRIQVDVDFYDTSGTWINWTNVQYLHIDNERWPNNAGLITTWNNPSSSLPRYVTPTWLFNNGKNGGWLMADVATLPGPNGCSTDEHIHMEATTVPGIADYRYGLTVPNWSVSWPGSSISDRWTDIFYYHLPGVNGTHP